VEDDQTIAQEIKKNLAKWNLDAQITEDFENVTETFREYDAHLVLMDISLPFFNGYYWCGEIRKISTAPIIFLSSRSDNMDILLAINMGGDEYITKPIAMEVLIAKVQAMLRRSYTYYENTTTMEFCGASLDLAKACVSRGEQKTDLTKNELKILQVLLENRNAIVSREKLMLRLWDSDSFVDENTLTVNINRLRKTLEEIGVTCIKTYKGQGYSIDG
jgi:two-component system, OmpR family, response regulator protein BraR/BceR